MRRKSIEHLTSSISTLEWEMKNAKLTLSCMEGHAARIDTLFGIVKQLAALHGKAITEPEKSEFTLILTEKESK